MSVKPSGSRWYNAVWRWHFYAAMLCVPFVLWLAITGTIYTWRPQIEAWLDAPYDRLSIAGERATPAAIVAAATGAVPGSRLKKYRLPEAPGEAVRVIVTAGGDATRVYVDPYRLTVLVTVREDERPMNVVSRLHGTLLAGDTGSYVVEIAASWAVVMLLTGLYLWWPRGRRGLAGVAWPRLRQGKRTLWRDLHAVTGIWVSVLALFLILSGLPWAKAWGSYLTEIRAATRAVDGPVDWTIAGKPVAPGNHAGHDGMALGPPPPAPAPVTGPAIDRVVAAAIPLGLNGPVFVSPPAVGKTGWTVASDTANRPQRSQAMVDGATGEVTSVRVFAEKHWIDRGVGYGIAAHEGQLFGIVNQLLTTLTAAMLMLLSVSGAVMWWRRRPVGLRGVPVRLSRPRFGAVLVTSIVLLGVLLPLFGATLVAVLVVERLVLRRLPRARRWLGLRAT